VGTGDKGVLGLGNNVGEESQGTRPKSGSIKLNLAHHTPRATDFTDGKACTRTWSVHIFAFNSTIVFTNRGNYSFALVVSENTYEVFVLYKQTTERITAPGVQQSWGLCLIR
jgi:hypothetical protein